MTPARSRRYRQDGTVLTDGFTVRLPLGLDGEARRISRVLGVTLGDFASRALREAIERALDDPDVRSAVDAMRRLDARQSRDPQPSSETGVEEEEGGDGPQADRGGAESAPGGVDSKPESPETDPEPRAPIRRREGPPKRRGPQQELSAEERRKAGSIVRAARMARHLTQAQVAAELSMPMQSISAVEVGKIGNGASATRVKIALEWATKPHPLDDAPAPTPAKKPSPMKPKSARAPERERITDWRPTFEPAPIVLPTGMELLPCPALRARITERACKANKARAKGDVILGDHCPSCQGVVALAKKRGRAA